MTEGPVSRRGRVLEIVLVSLLPSLLTLGRFRNGFVFDDQVAEDDTIVSTEGVSLVVDAMSQQYLLGARVDFEDGLEGSRFVIHNPNAQTTCGCGSSFSV